MTIRRSILIRFSLFLSCVFAANGIEFEGKPIHGKTDHCFDRPAGFVAEHYLRSVCVNDLLD